jgi:hypothetical protein
LAPLRSGGRPLHSSAFGAPSPPGTAAIQRMNFLQQATENIFYPKNMHGPCYAAHVGVFTNMKSTEPLLVFSPTSKS